MAAPGRPGSVPRVQYHSAKRRAGNAPPYFVIVSPKKISLSSVRIFVFKRLNRVLPR